VKYQFEYDERIRCAFIGAGGHSFRNIYPALQYAPVDLVAVCDLDGGRAADYARLFGAPSHYTDHRLMLAEQRPTAVFIVTSYNADGRVQATDIAAECLRAGAHVWMEKPTASSVAEVLELRTLSDDTGRYVMTGLKKMFTPAVEKTKQIIDSEEFGGARSISVRYPQQLPEQRDLPALVGFLDHIYHPGAIRHHLMGPISRLSYEREPRSGASVTSLRFASGAVGTLHLAAGSPVTSPLERVEVTGAGATVVIDNGVDLTYYRPGGTLPYGRTASFVVDDSVAPLHWRPEFSLGQLYNKNLFYLGYVPEILHFCDSVLRKEPPKKGTLADSLAIMRLFEAYRFQPEGTTIQLSPESV
jgi:predicted dehydrogenase